MFKGNRIQDISKAIDWLASLKKAPNDFSIPAYLTFEDGPESLTLWEPEICTPKADLRSIAIDKALPLNFKELQPEPHHAEAIRKALIDIQNGLYQKIVLARGYQFQKPLGWDVLSIASRFASALGSSTLIVWEMTDPYGTYGCAATTPERLFRLKAGQLMTEAVAGTVPRGNHPEEEAHFEKTLLTCPKIAEEHGIVVDMIRSTLEALGFAAQTRSPVVRKLPSLQHLVTPMTAIGRAHALEVAAALHPTPAVCGYPRDAAIQRIHELEPFVRKGYAGAFGWINPMGDGDFFVGLRGLQWDATTCTALAGGGIVQGSDPKSECEEAEQKLQSILNRLF